MVFVVVFTKNKNLVYDFWQPKLRPVGNTAHQKVVFFSHCNSILGG
jgi:hypothetical protein